MKQKRVTLADIALELGLSKFSVSRALAGKNGVSETTRMRVVQEAKRMGYAVKETQQKLVFQFDLVVFDNADMTEFWMGVIEGAQKEAKHLGVHLVTRPISNAEEASSPSTSEVDGVIGGSGLSRQLLRHYKARGVQTLLISTPTPGDGIHAVAIADEEGAFQVGQHLKSLGHVALSFVTDRVNKPSFANRERGFARFAAAEGLSYNLIEVNSNDPGRSFEHRYKTLRKQKQAATALFCSTDSLAFAVIHALTRLGLSVPKDVSVVGVYNTYESRTSIPKLSTVDVPRETIGKLALQQLHRLVTGQATDAPTRTYVATSLVVRESTARAPHKARTKYKKARLEAP